jgi:hypothetical protein
MLSENWEQLRRQWEYSHATSAVLNLLAVAALILSLLAYARGKNLTQEDIRLSVNICR